MTSPASVSGRILITGGAGYIGSVTAHLLTSQGFDVTVIDDCSTGHAEAVPAKAKFIQGTLQDREAIQEALKECTSVIHFAGKSLVNESVTHPDLYRQINVEGSRNLLEGMRTANIQRLVFSSSASTYGEPDTVPIAENARTHPTNPYGETKLAVEGMLSLEAKTRDLACISLRYFNVSGALEVANRWIGERHDPETHLIPNTLRSTASEPLKIFGSDWNTPDGTCLRDYIHVVDVGEAHIAALNALTPSTHKIFNLGSGRGYSVREVLETASDVLGYEIAHVEAPVREGDPAILVAEISKARAELNWEPTRNLRRMIEDSAKSLGLI
jgi:UDP-glucose 4-epimerase